MSISNTSIKILAGATSVPLPVRTALNATIEIISQGQTSDRVVGVKRAGGALTITPMAIDRTAILQITQDESLSASCGGAAPWSPSRGYGVGSLVFMYGRVYIAMLDHGPKPLFTTCGTASQASDARPWLNTAGDTGEVKDFFTIKTVADGYWPCDGTTINAPWSALHNSLAYDLRGRITVGYDASVFQGQAGSFGSGSGSNTAMIMPVNLPNATYSAVSTTGGGHQITGSVAVDTAYPTGNNPVPVAPNGWTTYDFASIAGTGSFFARTAVNNIQNGTTTHNHSATFTGAYIPDHTHNVSFNLNAATQVAISTKPPQLCVYRYVRL